MSVTKAENAKKNGRPRFDFSDKLALVRQLASIQCTDEEIAAGVGCSQDTLARARKREPEVEAAILEGKAKGRMSLRRAQYRKAMDGNPALLIWLGKQVLGQREKVESDDMDDSPEAVTVTIVDASRQEGGK